MLPGVSPSRRGRRGSSGSSGPAAPPETILWVADLEALLHALPAHSTEVRLVLGSLDLVRLLTLVDPAITIDRLVLDVQDWERPLGRWNGRIGQVDNLRSCTTDYGPEGDGPAHVDVRLTAPTPLSQVARAAYPLLGVERRHHGYGYVELGTVDAPVGALALLPSRTAPGIPDLPSHHLKGVGLSLVDLGLVGSTHAFDELRETADVPELTTVRQPILVAADGHLALSDRVGLPLVDLNVHNPIGRLSNFERPLGSLALTERDDNLTFTPVKVGLTPAGASQEPLHGWSWPARSPFTSLEVRGLRRVEAIDLSGLDPLDGVGELALYRRLAELAATGAILHSLPPSFTQADQVLGTTLAAHVRAPYQPTTGLVRELRTVPQRREAMQRFGGFFELAGHAETLGHRLLPTVSVVLSSMRPSRAAKVLVALSAQRYPHVEIALGLHGVDGPVGPEFEEAVRVSGAKVSRHDRATPFGSVLADTARRTTGDLIVKIDDDDVYGPRVIEDLVLAYLFSNADVVGKTTEFLYFEDIDLTANRRFPTERYHYQVAGGAMMLSRATLTDIGGWRPTPNSTDRSVLIRLGNSGGIGYRTQSLGYVYVRHSDGHTWEQSDSMLLRNTPEQWPRFMHEILEA